MRFALLVGRRTQPAPVIVLDVPPDFHEVPLESDVRSRTSAQIDLLDQMRLEDRAQREALSLYLEALAVRLASGSVVGTAFCAVQLDGHPSTATLTVALQPTGTADRGLAALGAAEAMRREGRYQSVELRELGTQLTVMAVAERPAVPGDDPSVPAGATLRELSAFVPVSGFECAAMVTLSTPCLEDWGTYIDVVSDICRTMQIQSTHPDFIR